MHYVLICPQHPIRMLGPAARQQQQQDRLHRSPVTIHSIKNMIWNIVCQTSNPDFLSLKALGFKPAPFIFKGGQARKTAPSQHKSISLSRPGLSLQPFPPHSDIIKSFVQSSFWNIAVICLKNGCHVFENNNHNSEKWQSCFWKQQGVYSDPKS